MGKAWKKLIQRPNKNANTKTILENDSDTRDFDVASKTLREATTLHVAGKSGFFNNVLGKSSKQKEAALALEEQLAKKVRWVVFLNSAQNKR